jgi:hypothetical protein
LEHKKLHLFDSDDLEEARAEGHAAGLAEGRATSKAPTQPSESALAAARAEGAFQERERIKGVLASPAVQKDPVLGARLALASGVTADNIAATLKAAAEGRQIAIDASWDEVHQKLEAERRGLLR